MFIVTTGLADYAVITAIIELEGEQTSLTYQQIADHIPCDRKTVAKSLKRLIMANRLQVISQYKGRGGYRYVVTR